MVWLACCRSALADAAAHLAALRQVGPLWTTRPPPAAVLPSAALLPHAALLPQSIRCVMLEFHDFGKNELKTWGMSPDGCIQVAQLLRSVPHAVVPFMPRC